MAAAARCAAAGCPLADGTRAGGTLVAMALWNGSSARMDLVFRRVIAEERSLDGTLTFVPLAPRWMVLDGLFVEDVQVAFPGEVKARSGTLTLDIPLGVLRPDPSAEGGVVPYTSSLYDVEWADGECYPRSGRVEIEGPAKVTVTFDGSTPATGKAEAIGERGQTEIDLPTTRNCPPR